jgi:YD repeat-containing protein
MNPVSIARPAQLPLSKPQVQFSGLWNNRSPFSGDFPTMGSFQRRHSFIKTAVKGVFALTFAAMAGMGIYSYKGQPSPESTIGTVFALGQKTATVTRDHQVINWMGFKTGSFDERGYAYDTFGRLVGRVDDNGMLYKTTENNGLRAEAPVGRIEEDGTINGFGMNELMNRKMDIQGLSRKELGAVAILAYF